MGAASRADLDASNRRLPVDRQHRALPRMRLGIERAGSR